MRSVFATAFAIRARQRGCRAIAEAFVHVQVFFGEDHMMLAEQIERTALVGHTDRNAGAVLHNATAFTSDNCHSRK